MEDKIALNSPACSCVSLTFLAAESLAGPTDVPTNRISQGLFMFRRSWCSWSSPRPGFLLCLFFFGSDKAITLLLIVFLNRLAYLLCNPRLCGVIRLSNACCNIQVISQVR